MYQQRASISSSRSVLYDTRSIGRLQEAFSSNLKLPSAKSHGAGTKQKVLPSAISKRTTVKLIVNGIDRTPKMLISSVYTLCDDKQVAGEIMPAGGLLSTASSMSLGVASSMALAGRGSCARITNSQATSPAGADSLYEDFQLNVDDKEKEKCELDPAPSAFCLPKPPLNIPRPPGFPVLITLKETPTYILYDRPNTTAEVDTQEAEDTKQDNVYYELVTSKQRKIMNAEVQTMSLVEKTRSTYISRCRKSNNACYMTEWLMHDTYTELEQQDAKKTSSSTMTDTRSLTDIIEESQVTVGKEGLLRGSEEIKSPLTIEEQLKTITESNKFKDAAVRMERALASNVYQVQQKFFKGLLRQDPFRLEVDYKYTLNHLWSFTCYAVKGRCATAMCWSKTNKNLLAVGYGKFYNEEQRGGIVCCWSVKNPSQPERMYQFENPVTHLDFARDHPNLLAVAFHDGSMLVQDIVTQDKNIIATSGPENAHYEPLWQVFWYHSADFYVEYETIITSGQDGRICRYRRGEDFKRFQLMKVSRVEGTVKGIEQSRRCRAHDTPISRHPGLLVLTLHPTDSAIYYVGSDEGCIHKCSTNYLHQHLDVFMAHLGPIYTIQFSPFCNRVFVTCGADWCIRIWAVDVAEPLITLTTTMDAVQAVVWSPVNATVLASISGASINLWDLRRKTLVPASTTFSPSKTTNTLLQFTDTGDNLIVGDIEGEVHVYGLMDMPFSPFYQEEHLVSAIEKALITRPDILTMLKKTGKPFSN